jgi:hypothetical protein
VTVKSPANAFPAQSATIRSRTRYLIRLFLARPE